MLARKSLAAVGLVTALFLALMPTTAWAQHGPTTDHLIGPGAWGDFELVSVERVTNEQDLVADVAVDPRETFAYLANWGEHDCAANSEKGGINSPDAGAWVIDISNPADPKTVKFIPHHQDSRPGEGMQVFRLTTKNFDGYVLVMNNEQCGKNGKGGVSLWDVTNPRKPVKLSEHFGDRGFGDVNEIHSSFAWDAGARAYVVMTDNIETTDVDILDITNPKRPRLIADFNLNLLAQQQAGKDLFQPELGLLESSLHDMIVKKINGDWIMLLSYWDGGYVQLNVNNPAAPVFIRDTDFNNPDPELLESTGISLPPEGNGHQAEFTLDNRFFIGTDEDFSPYRPVLTIDGLGERLAGEFGWTKPIVTLDGGTLNGPTVYGGYGCPQSAPLPPADTVFPPNTLAPGEEQIVVLQRGPVGDPSQNYEACLFSEKVEAAQEAGYDAVIIANHHTGAGGGTLPDAYLCGSMGHDFDVQIPGICIGHKTFHEMFNTAPNYTYPESAPAIGAIGRDISATATFDGWGYVHLFDRTVGGTAAELDTFAIPEAHDEDFAFGFEALTVHEVATSETNWSQAYLSYYSGGMRSIEIQCSNPNVKSTCELVETGGYLDPKGNDFWGVETFTKNGTTYVLGSDMDSGLWIFKDTAP